MSARKKNRTYKLNPTPFPSLKYSTYSIKNLTCSYVSIALTLLLLRILLTILPINRIVSLLTPGVGLAYSPVSIHPHNPNFNAQQQPNNPARPTPPRQCTSTLTPLMLHPVITLPRISSNSFTLRGGRPSGIGKRRISRPISAQADWYSAQGAPRKASSSLERRQMTRRMLREWYRFRSVCRSRLIAERPLAGPDSLTEKIYLSVSKRLRFEGKGTFFSGTR